MSRSFDAHLRAPKTENGFIVVRVNFKNRGLFEYPKIFRSSSSMTCFRADTPALLAPSEVYCQILSLSTDIEFPTFDGLKESQLFFITLQFPSYSANEIKEIEAEIEHSPNPRGVLLKHGFSFSFSLDQMEILLTNSDNATPQFTAIFVLYTYLSWIVAYSDQEVVDSNLMRVLIALAKISDSLVYSNFGFIAISAFARLYLWSLHREIDDVDGFLSILTALFHYNTTLPEPCNELIYSTLAWVHTQPAETQRKAGDFLKFVAGLSDKEVVISALKLTVRSIPNRDSALWQYFPLFIRAVDSTESDATLATLPAVLFDLIQQRPVTTVIGIEAKPFTELPPSNGVEVMLRLQTANTFQRGFAVRQLVEFDRPLQLTQLLDPSITVRLNTVASFAVHTLSQVHDFMMALGKHLLASLDSPYVWDFYATFFYLDKLFPPASLGELPFEFLFNRLLFNPGQTAFGATPDEFQRLSTFRFLAIEALLAVSPKSIEDILNWMTVWPLLFTETLHRFVVNHALLPSDREASVLLGRTLMTIALYYQTFATQDLIDRKSVV
jgi:hypothetical protein